MAARRKKVEDFDVEFVKPLPEPPEATPLGVVEAAVLGLPEELDDESKYVVVAAFPVTSAPGRFDEWGNFHLSFKVEKTHKYGAIPVTDHAGLTMFCKVWAPVRRPEE